MEQSGQPGQEYLDLADWRRRVGDLYRLSGPPPAVLAEFRRKRDDLFRSHPQTPIPEADRAGFAGLDWFPPDPAFRVTARFEPPPPGLLSLLSIETGGDDGEIHYRRAGTLRFRLAGKDCSLTVLSLIQYGGGLFVPFGDATSGNETYGGGRYLFDTAKGTDGLVLEIGLGSPEVMIDFNYAYNPSCAYNPRWACPLAPAENRLPVAVTAGERKYRGPA